MVVVPLPQASIAPTAMRSASTSATTPQTRFQNPSIAWVSARAAARSVKLSTKMLARISVP